MTPTTGMVDFFAKVGIVAAALVAVFGVIATIHAFIMAVVIKPAIEKMITGERKAREEAITAEREARIKADNELLGQIRQMSRDRVVLLDILSADTKEERTELLRDMRKTWLAAGGPT